MISGLIWIFTARCNLACKHCYVVPRMSSVRELPLHEKLELIDQAHELGIEYIGFSGGEPLIHPHFFKLVERCYEYGVETSVVTNGIALSEEVARRLARLEVYVNVSLDGPDRESHEGLRGPGTWERVLEGIEALKTAGAEFSTVLAIYPGNYSKAGDYVRFVRELGLDRASMIPVMNAGRSRDSGLAIGAKEYLKAIELATSAAEECGLHLSLWCTPFAPLVAGTSRISCWSCRLSDVADLDPGGRLLLCDVIDVVISSVEGKGLRTALEEFERHPLVLEISDPPVLPRECEECPIAWYCRGGCYARALLERRSLRGADPLCPRVAGLLG